MKPEIIESANFVQDAANWLEAEARAAISERDAFWLSLSGGNTPKPVYMEFAKRDLPWEKVKITFGDERCVPPDDAQSNFKMAKESFFDHAPIPAENIFRMKGELDPAEGAREYAALLDLHKPAGDALFRHDLILLGMGPDGHTASLFPGTPALAERERMVIENYVPKFSMWRLTFTYPLLNAARHVGFLLSKKGKEPVLDQILNGTGDYPSAHVQPTDGKLTWFIGE